MSGEWYIREYRCSNGICVKTKFPGNGDVSSRPGSKRHERYVRRSERGATEARHDAALALNENFKAGVDRYIGLDYSDEGLDEVIMHAGTNAEDDVYITAKKHILKNYIRRCSRACKKAGVPFRYLIVTSDRDGKTMKPARIHHHMVVNAEAAEIFKEKWTSGGVWDKVLYSARHGDLTDLAEYMIGQVRYFPNEKRYTPSRNLKKPAALPTRKVRNPDAELRIPKNCELIYRSENYAGRPQRVRYYRPPKVSVVKDDDESSREVT